MTKNYMHHKLSEAPTYLKARIVRDRLNGSTYAKLSENYGFHLKSIQRLCENSGCKGEDFNIMKKDASVKKCLSCASIFASFNVGHRLCDNCRTGAGIEKTVELSISA